MGLGSHPHFAPHIRRRVQEVNMIMPRVVIITNNSGCRGLKPIFHNTSEIRWCLFSGCGSFSVKFMECSWPYFIH